MRGSPLLFVLVLFAGCGARSTLRASEDGADGGAGASAEGAGDAGPGGDGGAGTGLGGAGGDLPISIIDACVIAASCGRGVPQWFEGSAGFCVDGFARLGWHFTSASVLPDPTMMSRILSCAAKTNGDCEVFRSCYGGDWVGISRCRDSGSCQGNVIVSPQEDGPSFDCGSIGATCQDITSGVPRACCNAEPCPVKNVVECDGTVASICGDAGEHLFFDCGQSGRTCQSDPQNPCAGAGDPCSEDTPIACFGSVATYCSGGRLATYDCSDSVYRTACNQGEKSEEAACVSGGQSCKAWGGGTACDGDIFQVCAGGDEVEVDCESLGFEGCSGSGQWTQCVHD